MGIPWTCPFCNKPCTMGDDDMRFMADTGFISREYETWKSFTSVKVCPNTECRKYTIEVGIFQWNCSINKPLKRLHFWQLVPESDAKPFPVYIPKQLRDDYAEACLIKNKSPKASATLSRRCLQGMIRDFWKVKKRRLIDEIDALQSRVDASTWKAIDSVRHVGNIGAHMEKDVDLIIDVDPEEAALIIGLIETLFEEWYIAKHDREERMKTLVKVADEKKELQKGSKPAEPASV